MRGYLQQYLKKKQNKISYATFIETNRIGLKLPIWLNTLLFVAWLILVSAFLLTAKEDHITLFVFLSIAVLFLLRYSATFLIYKNRPRNIHVRNRKIFLPAEVMNSHKDMVINIGDISSVTIEYIISYLFMGARRIDTPSRLTLHGKNGYKLKFNHFLLDIKTFRKILEEHNKKIYTTTDKRIVYLFFLIIIGGTAFIIILLINVFFTISSILS